MIIKNLQEYPKKPLGRAQDLTNKRFGLLTPLYRTEGKGTQWVCKCDCGNYTLVFSSNLKKGYTKSCGCFQKELQSKIQSKNITNQRFGKLIALYPTQKRNSDGSILWHCRCDCGNQLDVISSNLNNGHTVSCGCFLGSIGEEKISKILRENNIYFERQKTFKNCFFEDTHYLAKFDFYVNNQYLIEFDGKQHFEYSGIGWDTKENFQKIQKRDRFKNEWCKQNNISLIRIPYTHLGKICLNDLLLETSQFKT